MARRGRRRRSRRRTSRARKAPTKRRSIKGRVSRSTQNKANKKTSPKKSAPKARRQRQTSPKRKAAPKRSAPSNRRANVSKARRTAPKKTAPKKKAPTKRTTTKNKRGSGISTKRKNIGTKIGTSVKSTAKKVASGVKNTAKKVAKTVGKVTRPPSAKAKTVTNTRQAAFNKQVKKIQAANTPSVQAAKTPSVDASNYKSLSIDQQRAAQQGKYGETFGLNPITRRNEINRIQNMTKAQNAARVRLGLDPTFSGQSLKQAKDADGDGFADNIGNRIVGAYNTTLGRVLPKLPKQTVADANISMNRPMGQRLPGLVRKRGSSGGGGKAHTDPIRVPPVEATPFSGEALVSAVTEALPATGQGLSPTAGDSDNLTRIQNQAYATTLANNMAGLTGDFDFGPQRSQMSISQAPELQAGQSRGRRRIRRFGRGRRRGAGDSFRRGGRRIQQFTSTQLNI